MTAQSTTAQSGVSRVFLSHAELDKHAAREFAEKLRRNDIAVWFDQDDLQPGDPWMATLEKAIRECSAMIVYVGRLGVQSWVDRSALQDTLPGSAGVRPPETGAPKCHCGSIVQAQPDQAR